MSDEKVRDFTIRCTVDKFGIPNSGEVKILMDDHSVGPGVLKVTSVTDGLEAKLHLHLRLKPSTGPVYFYEDGKTKPKCGDTVVYDKRNWRVIAIDQYYLRLELCIPVITGTVTTTKVPYYECRLFSRPS